eukprot:gene9017-16659_t
MFTYMVREARISDQDAVNALSMGIYQGTDFTAKIFPEWIRDELWLPYVAETNLGQVVAFLALNITDGGRSVIVRSSRVAEEYRGHGVYKQLVNSALRFANKKLANLNCIIRARPAHIRIPVGYTAIKVYSKIILSCTPKSVDTILLPDIAKAMNRPFQENCLTVTEFSKLYNEEQAFRSLFVGDILMIEGETFHLSVPENWEHLAKRNDISFTYTRYDAESAGFVAVFSVLGVSDKETNDGKPLITLNIYGKESLMVGYHILKAMKTATIVSGCEFNLGLSVGCELQDLILQFAREELDFCKVVWERKLQVQKATMSSHFLCPSE